MPMDWNGMCVLVIGGARQGQAAARWLARHGARVILNDRRTSEEMCAARSALADTTVTWVLGSHPLELLDQADAVCISGGVPLDNPIVAEAIQRGILLTNDTQIFLEVVPCPTIGITGSAGKTTTTMLVGRMAIEGCRLLVERNAECSPKAWVGGNIGDPLLNHMDDMKPCDLAILEISSFQLEQMTISPYIAAILNITPNHLDRHGTMEAYTAAKARILAFQSQQDTAVLGRDNRIAWSLRKKTNSRLLSFGFSSLPRGSEGTFLREGKFFLRTVESETALFDKEIVCLRGDHNLLNAMAACTIAYSAGLPVEAMRAGIEAFPGVSHRLEFVRTWNGADWYNDSIATAPERTIAAIQSFSEPLVLLLGGRDKNLPWDDLAALIRARVDHVVLFGEAAGKIAAALERPTDGSTTGVQRPYTLARTQGLKKAVQAAAEAARPGHVVLFSPGGTSFDEFRDFEERGENFHKWVLELS